LPLPVGTVSDALAQLWREWRAKRRPIVLKPYVDLHSRWRRAARFLVPLSVVLACFIYGFFFALTAPVLIVPFAVPVGVLGLLAIWALPETHTAPVKTLEVFFSAGLAGLVMWPNYLALALPGLPWITMVRLTIFPAVFLLLLCLSSSAKFRKSIAEAAQGVPAVFFLLLLFALNSLISLPLAHGVGNSINQVILQQLTWTGMLIAGLYIFNIPGRAERYVGFLLLLAVPVAASAAVEYQEQRVMWAAHVPSFLKVADASAQLALMSALRTSTGLFRAKSIFSTPLGLAEFMALMTPLAVHWAVGRHTVVQRLIGLAMLPTVYVVVRMTDSRLGILGYLVSILTYTVLWSLIRFRKRLNDLLAAIMVYSYPAAIMGVLVASLFVHKIHVLIFGGGAQEASNLHRQDQFRMAIPAFLVNPIGHGAGQSGRAMGYGEGDFIAIDSYWISLSLDYGALGLVLYVGLFAVVIYAAVKLLLQHPEVARGETSLLIPLVSFLAAFLAIRGVFAQPDIHPLVFMVLGMTMCLVSRAKSALAASTPAPAPAPSGPGARAARGPRREQAKKPMRLDTVFLIVLGCAVVFYFGCVLWRLTH
jgi:hypothetical protein